MNENIVNIPKVIIKAELIIEDDGDDLITTSTDLKPFRLHEYIPKRVTKFYKCSYCDKEFYRKNFLTRHVKNHIDAKPFKCTYCAEQFPRKENLYNHIGLHTGKSRHPCEICGKRFTHRIRKYKHIKREHTLWDRNNLPFKCRICKLKFGLECVLNDHIDANHQYTKTKCFCDLCDICLPDERSHYQHYVDHHPEHPFVRQRFPCPFCPSIQKVKAHLLRHLEIHDNLLMKCDYCHRVYRHKSSLLRHIHVCWAKES